jgi:hypothetical protein
MINHNCLQTTQLRSQVSEVSFTPRTPQECRIRWLGDCHPQINHAPWSAEETARLKTIVSALPNSHIDWVAVSKQLRVILLSSHCHRGSDGRHQTNRSPIDCMRHGLQRFNHIWTPESDNRLIQYVKIYGLDNWSLGIPSRQALDSANSPANHLTLQSQNMFRKMRQLWHVKFDTITLLILL